MRIIFMGTPEFAAAPLERLYSDGHDVAGVFTQPDKPRNRGMKVSFCPVKEIAMTHGTNVFQPASFKDGSAIDVIRELECEMVTVVAYGKLLPKEILDIPPLGCINIHASLLPRYRGAAPIQWAVMNGETETGVTSMFMAEELDAGDIVLGERVQIGEDETAGELHDRLSALGAELLSKTIAAISRGEAVRNPQDHTAATFAPPLKKEISPINWSDTAMSVKCKIRGLNPWPVATAEFNGTVYKVFSAEIGDKNPVDKKPGDIISCGRRGIEVACSDASLVIRELQAPGGRRMTAAEYLRGIRGQGLGVRC